MLSLERTHFCGGFRHGGGGGGEGRGEHWTGHSVNYEFKFQTDGYGLFTMVPSSNPRVP